MSRADLFINSNFLYCMLMCRVSLCQMVLTMSLQFVSSTYQSVAFNLIPCIKFVLVLIFHQEKLMFRSMNGPLLGGLGISLGGALALLL